MRFPDAGRERATEGWWASEGEGTAGRDGRKEGNCGSGIRALTRDSALLSVMLGCFARYPPPTESTKSEENTYDDDDGGRFIVVGADRARSLSGD